MPYGDKFLLLRNYELWADMSEQDYQELDVVHNFLTAPKGEYIYFEAFNHNKLYFIKEGLIRIGHIDDKGKEVIREIIREGEVFGQITLEKNNLNGEFAQAYKSDVSLCAFTVESFQQLLRKKPELAIKYSKRVGSQLRNIENRLLNLLNKDVRSRLIGFMNELISRDLKDKEATQYCVSNFLSHEDIAHLIGSSRQTVTTIINDLSRDNLLQYSRQKICFPDVKKIQKLASVG